MTGSSVGMLTIQTIPLWRALYCLHNALKKLKYFKEPEGVIAGGSEYDFQMQHRVTPQCRNSLKKSLPTMWKRAVEGGRGHYTSISLPKGESWLPSWNMDDSLNSNKLTVVLSK